jgi:hypothetical protein
VSDAGNPNDPTQPEPWGGNPPPPQQGYGAPPPPGYGASPPQQGYGAPPPGWGAPPQQGYGGYGGYAAPQTDGKAIGALIASIASFVICPFIPAVVGVILAGQSARAIRESNGRLSGEGLAMAAKVIGWINIVLCVLGVGLVILSVAIGSTSRY